MPAVGQTCTMPSQRKEAAISLQEVVCARSLWCWKFVIVARSLVLFEAEVLGLRFKFAAEKPFLSPKELG